MKHIILTMICMGMFFQLYCAAPDAVVTRDDKGNLTLNVTVNASSQNSNAVSADTKVEQISSATEAARVAEAAREKTREMNSCKKKHGKKFIECMHRLRHELYQEILRTINDEEVKYYYEQLKLPQNRAQIRAKFTQEEWDALALAKPEFTAKIDEIVRILKK